MSIQPAYGILFLKVHNAKKRLPIVKRLCFIILNLICAQTALADWQTIFAHGIVDGPTQINRFTDAIATSNQKSVQFPDATAATDWGLNGCIGSITSTLLGKTVNRSAMYMGQGPDIAAIHANLQEGRPDASLDPRFHEDDTEKLILYGCSRGAAAIVNYVAQHNPDNLKALVLDATPADIPANIRMTLASLGINPNHANSMFKIMFPAYPADAVPPIQAIKQIKNKQLPILLIHSQTDQRVDHINSYKLYLEFIRQGFSNVHLAIMPSGRHSFLLQDETIKPMYLQVVHSFYKKYDVPYDATWTKTELNLQDFQPTTATMLQAINEHEEKIQDKYQQACKRNMLVATLITAAIIAALIQKFR